jgi:hypothetical protein
MKVQPGQWKSLEPAHAASGLPFRRARHYTKTYHFFRHIIFHPFFSKKPTEDND